MGTVQRADPQRRLAEIISKLGEIADEIVRAASQAEIASWNSDVRALSLAAEQLRALHAQYNREHLALLAADNTPRPPGVDACSQ